jgi:sulfate transport system ATP-binding protein
VMNDGRIEQVGTADDIYDRPATPFVFDFIGDSSALPVTIDKGHVFLDDRVLALDAKAQPDGPATLFFRPNHIELSSGAAQESGALVGVVRAARRIGDIRRLELEAGLARHRFEIDVPIDASVNVQGRIAFRIVKSRLFPGHTADSQAVV